jgi:hypothetical protein
VCIWSLNGIKDEFKKARDGDELKDKNDLTAFKNYKPKASYESKTVLLGCDHSYEENAFATAG